MCINYSIIIIHGLKCLQKICRNNYTRIEMSTFNIIIVKYTRFDIYYQDAVQVLGGLDHVVLNHALLTEFSRWRGHDEDLR